MVDTPARRSFRALYVLLFAMFVLLVGQLYNMQIIQGPRYLDQARDNRERELSTRRGTEYCGAPDRHPYELYLAIEDIEHTRTRTRRPQTNGICERFHKTVLNEFYRVAFRKHFYRTVDALQTDLDAFMADYNGTRPHQGRWCYGKTPMQTFLESVRLAKEKQIA